MTGGATLAILVVVLATLKWLQTGSSLVVFVGGAALAAIVLDVVVSRAVVNRARLSVTSSTYDAVVGDVLTLWVRVAGPARPVILRGAGIDRGLRTVQVEPPAAAKMPCPVGPRGVFTRLEIDVSSTGLSGLLGWGRSQRSPFAEPIYVGPQPVDPETPLPELAFTAPEGAPQPSVSGDIVRGVRPYVRGDALRRVHWPATARAGELMVMDVDEPVAPRLLVMLNLVAPGPAAELAAGRASWYAREALRRDYDVSLATLEAAGPVARPVRSEHDVNRRLATAVVGPPMGTPVGDGVSTTVMVSDGGDTWVS